MTPPAIATLEVTEAKPNRQDAQQSNPKSKQITNITPPKRACVTRMGREGQASPQYRSAAVVQTWRNLFHGHRNSELRLFGHRVEVLIIIGAQSGNLIWILQPLVWSSVRHRFNVLLCGIKGKIHMTTAAVAVTSVVSHAPQ